MSTVCSEKGSKDVFPLVSRASEGGDNSFSFDPATEDCGHTSPAAGGSPVSSFTCTGDRSLIGSYSRFTEPR